MGLKVACPIAKKHGSKRNVSHWKKHIGLNAYIRKGEKKQWSVFPILELKNKETEPQISGICQIIENNK